MTSNTMFLHVGQCGNQVALPLWSLAAAEHRIASPDSFTNDHNSSGAHPLFDPASGHARAVFVDSEPKAIGDTLKGLPAGVVRPSNVCLDARASGLGNNWAMGFGACADDEAIFQGVQSGGGLGQPLRYHDGVRLGSDPDSSNGCGLFSSTTEAIRREAERCDGLRHFVLMHSMSGGTGSGVGSALLGHVRDYYPSSWLMPVSIGAFARGDTPLQAYNTLFSLQYLAEYSDGTIFVDNDELAASVFSQPPPSSPASSSSGSTKDHSSSSGNYAALNQTLAHDLAALLFPLAPLPSSPLTSRSASYGSTSSSSSSGSGLSHKAPILHLPPSPRPIEIGKLLSTVCPLPRLRFLSMSSSLRRLDCSSEGLARRQRTLSSSSSSSSISASDRSDDRQRDEDWRHLTKKTMHALPTLDLDKKPVVTFAAHWVLRGRDDHAVAPSLRLGPSLGPSTGGKRGYTSSTSNSNNSSNSSSGSGSSHSRSAAHGGIGYAGGRQKGGSGESGQRAQRALMEASSATAMVWKVRGPVGGDYGGGGSNSNSSTCSSSSTCNSGFASLAVPKVTSVLANRSSVGAQFKRVGTRAAHKYLSRAYVHWYMAQGLEHDDFTAAFESLTSVVAAYQSLAAQKA